MKKFGIEEALRLCDIQREIIQQFIEEEWVHPFDDEAPAFDDEDLARIRLINELRDDFGVNDQGISIILQLVDQLNRMHLELRARD